MYFFIIFISIFQRMLFLFLIYNVSTCWSEFLSYHLILFGYPFEKIIWVDRRWVHFFLDIQWLYTTAMRCRPWQVKSCALCWGMRLAIKILTPKELLFVSGAVRFFFFNLWRPSLFLQPNTQIKGLVRPLMGGA